MPLVTHSTPSLVGGVSQQPAPMRLPEQCEAQENALGTVVEGLRKRPPTEHLGTMVGAPTGVSAYHTINRDATERYQVTVEDKTLRVFDLADGTIKTVYDINGDVAALGTSGDFDYLATTAPQTDIEFMSIADYTIVINKAIQAKMDSATSANRGFEALAFVKQGNYKTDYKITVDSATVTYTTPDSSTADHEPYVQTDFIANVLYDYLTNASPTPPSEGTITSANVPLASGTYDTAIEGSTVWIKKDDGSDFTITVDDSVGSTVLVAIKDSVQSFTELPVVAPEGFQVKIDGLPDQGGSGSAGYYVGFETTEGGASAFGDGSWEEVAAQGIEYKTDYTTMPHILVRLSSGDFLWTEVGGGVLGGTIGSTAPFTAPKWGEVEAGDTTSNPRPAWIAASDGTGGDLIRGISFFKDRLVVLAGESVGLSESGQYFNSFKTTVTTVLDSGRIEVIAAHTRVNLLNHAVPLRENLVLFSEFTQFVLRGSSEGTLTPKNVSVTATSEYEATKSVKPTAAKRSIFFAGTRGTNTNILELFDTSANRPQFEAVDITGQAPSYVQGSTSTMVASPTEDCLVIKAGDDATLYVYKWMVNGGNRVQSAWSKFTLGGTGTEIMDVDWVDQYLYLVVRRGTETSLERMDFEPFLTDTDSDFRVHLDRRVDESDCSSVTYDSAADETTFTLPYTVGTGATMEVVAREVTGINDPFNLFQQSDNNSFEGWVKSGSTTPSTATVVGPLSGSAAYLWSNSTSSQPYLYFPFQSSDSNRLADETTYTYSVYLKYGGAPTTITQIWDADVAGGWAQTRSYQTFHWNTDGTLSSVATLLSGSASSAGYDAIGGGWYRAWHTIEVEWDDGDLIKAELVPNGDYAASLKGTYFWGPQVVKNDAMEPYGHSAGLQYAVNSATSNTVKVKGDLTTRPVWIGEQYTLKYTFSEMHLQRIRTGGGRTPLSAGNHRLRYCRLFYADTAYFTAKVTPVGESGYTYTMTGAPLGATNNTIGKINPDTGVFKFPVMAKHDGVSISLENSSPLPSRFVTAEWESQFHSRVGTSAHFG